MTTRLMSACHRYAHTGASLALGVFIVWQLAYFAVANSLETLEVVTLRYPETSAAITKVLNECRAGERPHSMGPLAPLIYVIDKYGQLTEQPQRWSLFAPTIGDQTTFLAYELCWHDREQSIWLLSDDEPGNPAAYWRFLGNRVRSLEQNLTLNFTFEAGETEEQARQRWASQIRAKLAHDFDILIAWSGLRMQMVLQANPELLPPDEVIIHIRGYETPAPNATASAAGREIAPYCIQFARWTPGKEYPREVLPIEAFDPITQQFVLQSWTTETDQ